MKERIRFLFRNYWVEMLVIPPFLIVLCYYLYGAAYFSSWQNFGRMTFPWLFVAFIAPIGCHWVRRVTLHKFTKLDEWPKRVVWSLLGYLFFTVGFAKLTYFMLTQFAVSAIVRARLSGANGLEMAQIHFVDLVPSEKNFYGVLIIASMCVLIIATLYECITYFGKWRDALTETEQVEKLLLESQFQSLQSQLNPHFLFNSLNVLSSLISENPRRAEDFVDELSNVYRYLLRSNEREVTSVDEELRFIRSFFHLLETRHDTGVSMKINVGQENYDKNLPALALQILVENAVKHNEISPERPLNIEIFSQQPIPTAGLKMPESHYPAQIVVRNNLQRKATRPKSNHVGLDNLSQRYELLGVPGFDVCDDGEFFAVTLPLMGSEL